MELHSSATVVSGSTPNTIKRGHLKTDRLLRELSDDNEEHTDVTHLVAGDVLRPWMREFNHNIQVCDEVPEGMTLVQWWGVYFHLNSINQDLVKLNFSLDE